MIARRLLTFSLVGIAVCRGSIAEQAEAPVLNAEKIMARVAANQDRAEQARTHYVYVQHAHVLSRKGATVMCEETTDTRVTPSADGSHAELLKLQGRLLRKHAYFTYTTLKPEKVGHATDAAQPAQTGEKPATVNLDEDGLDRDLVEGMRDGLTRDGTKDGFDRELFPLTSKAQTDYHFDLVGRERINGRDAYHITFRPKDNSDFDWKGDAYVDEAEYQPVEINTELARKIPFAVRTLLGTNLPGLGFAITYAPQSDGIWFPVSFGTEFKMRVLFFFGREIVIDARNEQFEKTHVSSRILEANAGVP